MSTKINDEIYSQSFYPITDMHHAENYIFHSTLDETSCLLNEIDALEAMERQDALPLDEFLNEAPEFNCQYFLAALKNY